MEVIEHLSPARQASTIEGGALLACLAGMAIMRKLGGEGWLIPHRKDIGAGVAVLVVVAGLVSAGILPEDKWAPLAGGGYFLIPWMSAMCLFFTSLIARGDHPPHHFHRFILLGAFMIMSLRRTRESRGPDTSADDLQVMRFEWITLEVFALWTVKLRLARKEKGGGDNENGAPQ